MFQLFKRVLLKFDVMRLGMFVVLKLIRVILSVKRLYLLQADCLTLPQDRPEMVIRWRLI